MGKEKKPKTPIGGRLRQAREQLQLSQKQLGILAGIDRFSASARVNQYEQDKHVPDYSTAKRLAKVLGVSVTYLYADEDGLAEFIALYSEATPSRRARAKKELQP